MGLGEKCGTKGKKNKRKPKNSSYIEHKSVSVRQNSISLLTTNTARMRYKDSDLKNKVKFFNSAIFSVQETHYTKRGSLLWRTI